MSDANQNKKKVFRPKARIISVLGEQLIRDATVGLIELVKNGYDADATHVTVKLLNLLPVSKEQTQEDILNNITIIVEDDGYGMDLETIVDKWLVPATGHKEEAKKKNERTPKGRLPLGEKGVGRFAAQKIGRELILLSRARIRDGNLSEVESVVKVHWDDFDDPSAYLNEVEILYEERTPQYFRNNSGTFLEMKHSRDPWKERDVERVSRSLRRLMSPFRTPDSFEVKLICPDYPKYENLDPGDLLSTAHARLDVLVNDDGTASFDYYFKRSPYEERIITQEEVDLRMGLDSWSPVDRKSKCGGFYATFFLWDRQSEILELSGNPKNIANDLNLYNGVSVFRDGIRVLPYGEPKDDWLNIDLQRYMKTSEAISRKNIIGAVEISQEINSDLRDKSNREGFIENNSYQDFYNLMTSIVNLANIEFSYDRKKIREKQKSKKKDLIPAITRLENSVAEVDSALDEALNTADALVKEGKISSPVADEIKEKLIQTQSVLKGATEETRQATADTLVTFDEKQEMLLSLAGIGMAAEQFTHEFARLTRESTLIIREISNSTIVIKEQKLLDRVKALEATLDALHDLVLQLGPMFYIRRKTKTEDYHVKTLIEHAKLLNQSQIRINNIKFSIKELGGDLFVRARRSNLIQVFNNLIDNSCYWLSRKSEENEREIRITILSDQNQVVVADNGPGINPRDRNRIFDPFFSNKVNGRGLGLFIAREALAEIDSHIDLIDNEDSKYTFRVGASFLINFSDEITSLG